MASVNSHNALKYMSDDAGKVMCKFYSLNHETYFIPYIYGNDSDLLMSRAKIAEDLSLSICEMGKIYKLIKAGSNKDMKSNILLEPCNITVPVTDDNIYDTINNLSTKLKEERALLEHLLNTIKPTLTLDLINSLPEHLKDFYRKLYNIYYPAPKPAVDQPKPVESQPSEVKEHPLQNKA